MEENKGEKRALGKIQQGEKVVTLKIQEKEKERESEEGGVGRYEHRGTGKSR